MKRYEVALENAEDQKIRFECWAQDEGIARGSAALALNRHWKYRGYRILEEYGEQADPRSAGVFNAE
jgi:hypothetical protein